MVTNVVKVKQERNKLSGKTTILSRSDKNNKTGSERNAMTVDVILTGVIGFSMKVCV